MTETRTATSAVLRIMISTSGIAQPIARITETALGKVLMKRMVTEMLVKRKMDEMITHFNDVVSAMDISSKDKMTILGMITAIGYEYQKAADVIEELQAAKCPHYIRNIHNRGDDSLCRFCELLNCYSPCDGQCDRRMREWLRKEATE